MAALTGRCMCGACRFRLDAVPYDTGWCHCHLCRLASGAPGLVFATVPFEAWTLTQGKDEIRTVASSSFGERQFCGACGTPLTMHVRHQFDEIDFTVCTLDDPGGLAPGFHIFWGSRVGWFDPKDGLPRFDKFRPNTRGLDGTDPPE